MTVVDCRPDLLEPADAPAAVPGIEVVEVRHAYTRRGLTLDGVSLAVPAGSVHCLLGPSGSGKSTLLRLIAGLEMARSGTIRIGGDTVCGPGRHVSPERRQAGFVFQDFALFPHLNVRKNVMFGMVGRTPRLSRGDRIAAADDLIERVGMAGFEKKMPHTLSGGQQQRVALARAMARGPKVMLLDEPFSGLDATLREHVRETTLRVLKESGVATLMVTHDPHEALAAADHVSVMRSGQIDASGLPDDVCVCFGSGRSQRVQLRTGAELRDHYDPANRVVCTK